MNGKASFYIKSNITFLNNIFRHPDGTQTKFQRDGYWYKIDQVGGEGLVEELASLVLGCSSLPKEYFVSYEYGKIDKKDGCRSRNFLNKKCGEYFISFAQIYSQKTKKSLSEAIHKWGTAYDRKEEMVSIFYDICGVDITEYLARLMTIDYVIFNTDRHLNNMGMIFNKQTGIFKPSPIFDNGRSLGVGLDHIESGVSKAFDRNPYTNFQLFGPAFSIDYLMLEEKLAIYKECQWKNALLERIREVRKDIPNKEEEKREKYDLLEER